MLSNPKSKLRIRFGKKKWRSLVVLMTVILVSDEGKNLTEVDLIE